MRWLLLWSLLASGVLATDFIKVQGGEFRDQGASGAVVPLRGVNLGGWLMIEPWMCPVNSEPKPTPWTIPNDLRESGVEDVLVNRFGVSTKDDLLEVYRQHWITETDVQVIADQGMNLLRLPFSYRLFMEPQADTVALGQVVWKPDAVAFKYLDLAIAWAAARGMRVLLDLHEVEGVNAQGTPAFDHDPASFWYNAVYRDRAQAIWVKIAQRYASNPTVIGYDLLNEPWSQPVWLYDAWYQAIRAVDPNHILFMETWDFASMPTPTTSAYHWDNVACSLHWYPAASDYATSRDDFLTKLATSRSLGAAGSGAALHIGEFHFMAGGTGTPTTTEMYRDALQTCEAQRIAWTKWTAKSVDQGGWSLYSRLRQSPAPVAVDLTTASSSAIAAAWATWTTPTDATVSGTAANDLATPVPADDLVTASEVGTWRFTASDLLANDRRGGDLAEVTVQPLPARSAHGTIRVLTDGWLYQADPGFSGTDTLTYGLTDARRFVASVRQASVAITVTTTAAGPVPTGTDDTYASTIDGLLTVTGQGVLGNDIDPDGRLLTAALATPASHGTVTLASDGSFTYQPSAGFTGDDQFTYRPRCGSLAGAPVTVSLRITAPGPTNATGLLGTYSYPRWQDPPSQSDQRVDATIDLNVSQATGPGFGLTSNYAVTWTGFITAPISGTYTFEQTVDDQGSLTIGGTTVIPWANTFVSTTTGSVSLVGGVPTAITATFIQFTGNSVARLRWATPLDATLTVVPTSVLTSGTATLPAPAATVIEDGLGVMTAPTLTWDTAGQPVLGGPVPTGATTIRLYHSDTGALLVSLPVSGSTWSASAANVGWSSGTLEVVAVARASQTVARSAVASLAWSTVTPPSGSSSTSSGGGGGGGGCGLGGSLAVLAMVALVVRCGAYLERPDRSRSMER